MFVFVFEDFRPLHCLQTGDLYLLLRVCADGYHNRTLAITGKNNTHDYCCRLPLSNPFHNNWRNDLIVTYLNSLDLSWRETVGWVPLFNTTLELFDLHIEYNSRTGIVDCTHFFYVPAAFAAFWWDLRERLRSLTLKSIIK